MTDPSQPLDPKTLGFLKVLVTTLTAVMILGLVVIVTLLVLRFGQTPSAPLPGQITLPDGKTAIAVTHGPGWYAVATEKQILIFALDGTLRQTVDIVTD